MSNEMGTRIYNLRKEKGMTLEELGSRVGVGKSTVRKWETGFIANMKRDKILLVAEALGVTPSYLMGYEEKKEKVPAPEFDPMHIELINLYEQLTEESKRIAIELLRNLARK